MYFHHLHFYLNDTAFWKVWFAHHLGFSSAANMPNTLTQGNIEIRLSSSEYSSDVAHYLSQHPSGLVDIAFATDQFDAVLATAQKQGATLLQPVSQQPSQQRQCQLQGWAHLRHTLVEVSADWIQAHHQTSQQQSTQSELLSLIDHVVINVPRGELSAAVQWYQAVFGLQLGQSFEINTANSGLCSQVLVHPEGTLQLPINEPSSDNSQIQEFLHHNRGAGVQHVALRSQNALRAIAHFRNQGLQLLSVPQTYYDTLKEQPDCPLYDLSDITQQQLLLDWSKGGEQGMLLQTFTQPIFAEPTFFFEVIERSDYKENGQVKIAQGFGEGNFQALFEAIEQSQLERGSLTRT
ncbi:MAG: 4-hydroxyphenylpyruvate dioxygenase [Cyanobacteria bacterium P01_C01_bin.69]